MLNKFPGFAQVRILVVGDVMLDRYWCGSSQRISPEAPVPVVVVDNETDRPGGAGNVAANIASLGAKVRLLSIIGDDAAGATLAQILQQQNIDHDLVVDSSFATITKLRILSQNQQLLRLDFERSCQPQALCRLQQNYQQALAGVDVVLLSDYGKGVLGDPQTLIRLAQAAGVPVVVDPKGNNLAAYRGASLLTPNRKELQAMLGSWNNEAELQANIQQAMVDNAIESVLLTRSEQGMTLFSQANEPQHLPTEAREIFDVTGAGDTVIAVYAASIGAGLIPADAMRLANLAAGIVVGRVGAASVSAVELHSSLLRSQGCQRGVISREHLQQLLLDARAKGERIVFTNGCFDLIHAGHVGYLQQAKALGDRLVVAVNDDASVARLKGQDRPINPLERRMTVLSGLSAVDWVVPFSEDTPAALIENLQPDILVKGGDYQISAIAGADTVLANGGEVKILGFEPGCSTTEIVKQIKRTTTA